MPKYIVNSITETREVTYEDGVIGEGTSWIDPQTIVTTDTPIEAVQQHIEDLGYDWNKDNHDNKSYYTLLDVNNAELTPKERKAWIANEFRAWEAWIAITIYKLEEIHEV